MGASSEGDNGRTVRRVELELGLELAVVVRRIYVLAHSGRVASHYGSRGSIFARGDGDCEACTGVRE